MRDPQFNAYIGPAKLYPELWRLLLGVFLIAFSAVGTLAIILVAAYPIVGPMQYFSWLMGLAFPDSPSETLVVLGSFFGMALGAILAAGTCHFRGPGSLFGPLSDTLRGFLTTVAVLIPIYIVLFAVNWGISKPLPGLPLTTWLMYLPLALPLVFLQITAEEMIFRGYLQQQLAARFAARWIWMGLPALIFTALHYNPSAGLNTWLILIVTLAYALIAADLTERTGSLGAAMGLHFVNNVFALLVVSVSGTITGLALFLTPYSVADGRHVPLGLGLDLLLMAIIWLILRRVVAR